MSVIFEPNLNIDVILDLIQNFLKRYYHENITKESFRLESFKKENDITKVTIAFKLKGLNSENFNQVQNFQEFLNLKDQTELKVKTFEIIDNIIVAFYDYQ